MKKILLFLLIIFSVFLRFYNLEYTARFTRDESSDLVSIKKIYDHKKITLIGPMDEGKIEVFSSLTYYLFLPFCIIFGFDPIVTASATAFYGLLTIIFIAYILKKRSWSSSIFILSVVFTPFLISSRWAWNPHLIPFWQALSLLVLFSKLPYRFLLTGILMGFTIHQHWYAVFTAISIIPIIYFTDKKFKPAILYSIGLFISITPFILFDLTHPPGLFITRMLYFSPLSIGAYQLPFLTKLWINSKSVFQYFSGNQLIFGYISLALTLFVIIKYKTKNHLWFLPIIFQIIALSLTRSPFRVHYVIPAALFYIFWLYQNQKIFLVKLLTVLLIIFNILNLKYILNFSDWSHNIKAKHIINTLISNKQKGDSSFNLVVLQSPDNTTKGLSFKDYLTLNNISIKDPSEYKNIDTLYVVSYQEHWSKLSQDPAYELDAFRNLTPHEIIKIENSNWYLYKISKN
ncbi:MAG TPA: hypothetical protein VN174_03445 [Candidatus Methanoperedens sp.]|nr:hypothetical protein [Candidatus Methanoperedens sp.]